MDLVKSWMGQALRATGAAIVVPLAILAALSLTAIGGSGLGGLSQIVSGPRVAGSDVSVDDGDAEITDAVTELAARGGAPDTTGGGTAPGSPAPGGGDPQSGGGSPPGSAPNPPASVGPSPPGDGNGGNEGGGGDPPAGPPPPEPPDPGLVGGAGETVKQVTAGTPVAPTVEDAVDGLVETCSRLGCP